jgi:hypothetical protein
MWMWCFFRFVPLQNRSVYIIIYFLLLKNDWSPGSLVGKRETLFIVLSFATEILEQL